MLRRGRPATEIAGEILDVLDKHLHCSTSEEHDRHHCGEQNDGDIMPTHMPSTISPIFKRDDLNDNSLEWYSIGCRKKLDSSPNPAAQRDPLRRTWGF